MGFTADLQAGLHRYYLWGLMGWRDIQRRYQRSLLGPFWLLLNSLIMVGVMGPLYSHLLHVPMSDYISYILASMISWQLITAILSESPNVFLVSSSFIVDVNLPFSTYVLQMLWRNLIIYAHGLPIILIVSLIFGKASALSLLLYPVNISLVVINCYFACYLLATLGARYRDVFPIVTNLLQVLFFVTPIIWQRSMLGEYQWITDFNGFYHALELLRAPFLGYIAQPLSYIYLGASAVIGYAVCALLSKRANHRLAYWV